jgi:uncharacterized protein (DUF1800 family)
VNHDFNDPVWAWAPFEPDSSRPWTLELASHLFRRAAFGGNWAQLQQALADGPQAAIDQLVRPAANPSAFQKLYDEYETAAATSGGSGAEAWWLRRMIETPHPLLERVTLFWHSHFGVSNVKVKDPALICQFTHTLRRHALGSYSKLLDAAMAEPAVFAGLDARANRKSQPPEAMVRVILEQYTVGPGNFSEADVRDAARSLTGWMLTQGTLRFVPREFDSGQKKILGSEGEFGRQDLAGILVRHSSTSRWLASRLYREMISETAVPSSVLLEPLTASLSRDGNLGPVVELMLRSNLFFSPVALRQKVKSPVDYAVGIARSMEAVPATLRLASDLAALGQNLYAPPVARGWVGGSDWLNQFTLLRRQRLAQDLFALSGPYESKLDPAGVARKHGFATPEAERSFLAALFLSSGTGREAPDISAERAVRSPVDLRDYGARLACLPEFQLA